MTTRSSERCLEGGAVALVLALVALLVASCAATENERAKQGGADPDVTTTGPTLENPKPQPESPALAAGETRDTETASAPGAGAGSPRIPWTQTYEEQGIHVRLDIVPLGGAGSEGVLEARDDFDLRFTITDSTTGSPLSGLTPAVWVDPQSDLQIDDTRVRIQSYLSGSLTARAQYDLNVFYVLAMNEDPTISVVDPLFSYGGSRLLSMVFLPSPGEDWVLTEDGSTLLVSCPLVNRIAVVDTMTWLVRTQIEVATQPTRIGLQPDGRFLWVSCRGPGDDAPGQVCVIDVEQESLVDTIPIGKEHHTFAFSADSLHAYVGCSSPPSVTVIDVQNRAPVAELLTAGSLDGLGFSESSGTAYAVDGTRGKILAIDGRTHELRTEIDTPAGSGAIFFAPGGEVGLIVHPDENVVHVLNTARNQIVQTGDVGPRPDQITFTENLAYVRSLGSEIVLMIPLEAIGEEGPVPIVDFNGGQLPFGLGDHPSPAAGIVPAPNGVSVLVANPADRTIYYYTEGMAAPMGEFQNYDKEPRAVLVVDKSLQEGEPGVYSSSLRVDEGGLFGIYLLLDYPTLHRRFDLWVEPAEEVDDGGPRTKVTITTPSTPVPPGEEVTVEFEVVDLRTGKGLADLADLNVLVHRSSVWQKRGWAESRGDGRYEFKVRPPEEGLYFVFVQIPSRKFKYADAKRGILRVLSPESASHRTASGENEGGRR